MNYPALPKHTGYAIRIPLSRKGFGDLIEDHVEKTFLESGPKWTRTTDLLIANEAF